MANCTAIGGTAVSAAGGCLCKVSGTSCTSGWTQLNNWSTTSSRSCSGGGAFPCTYGWGCTTGAHTFEDKAREQCTTASSSLDSQGDSCVNSTGICSAVVTEVGCK